MERKLLEEDRMGFGIVEVIASLLEVVEFVENVEVAIAVEGVVVEVVVEVEVVVVVVVVERVEVEEVNPLNCLQLSFVSMPGLLPIQQIQLF